MRERCTGNNPQAVAERAACRQPQQLGRDHRPGDAEQPRDILRRPGDAVSGVLDKVAAIRQSPDADAGSGVETVVGQLLENQAAQFALRHPSLLLKSIDGAEASPVGPLEFQILGWLLAW